MHELQQAELRIIYVEQHRAFADVIQCLLTNKVMKDLVLGKLNPFLDLDNNGMIRVLTGKCKNNVIFNSSSKYPLLLDGHLLELILRSQYKILKYVGLQPILLNFFNYSDPIHRYWKQDVK